MGTEISMFVPPRLHQTIKVSVIIMLAGCLIVAFFWAFSSVIFTHSVPLYDAAQQGNWKQVETLLAAGANPNDTNDLQNDRTAIFWAAYQGRADMVCLLIQKGADVNIVDTHGQTALDYAGGHDRGNPTEVVLLLEKSGAKKSSDL